MFEYSEKSSRGTWIIGHRGAMGYAPENTLASFKAGQKMGADFLECDVRLTQDLKCVVIHDESLKRTTSGGGLVQEKTFSQIKKMDAGVWFSKKFKGQRVLLLEDLLYWVKKQKSGRKAPLGLVIEIKNEPTRCVGIEKIILESIRKTRMSKRVILISFDHSAVKKVKLLQKDILTGILYGYPLKDPCKKARQVFADAVFPRRNLVSKALVKAAHEKKLFVGTWTVNEVKEMKKLIQTGVDAIASNFPDVLNEVLTRAAAR